MLVKERGGLQSCEYRDNKCLLKSEAACSLVSTGIIIFSDGPTGRVQAQRFHAPFDGCLLGSHGRPTIKVFWWQLFPFWISQDCCTVSAATVFDFSVNLDYNLVTNYLFLPMCTVTIRNWLFDIVITTFSDIFTVLGHGFYWFWDGSTGISNLLMILCFLLINQPR